MCNLLRAMAAPLVMLHSASALEHEMNSDSASALEHEMNSSKFGLRVPDHNQTSLAAHDVREHGKLLIAAEAVHAQNQTLAAAATGYAQNQTTAAEPLIAGAYHDVPLAIAHDDMPAVPADKDLHPFAVQSNPPSPSAFALQSNPPATSAIFPAMASSTALPPAVVVSPPVASNAMLPAAAFADNPPIASSTLFPESALVAASSPMESTTTFPAETAATVQPFAANTGPPSALTTLPPVVESKGAPSALASLLSSMDPTMPPIEFSKTASEIVGGTLDSFLGESEVSGEERSCISRGASSIASTLTETCGQAMQTWEMLKRQSLHPELTPQQNPRDFQQAIAAAAAMQHEAQQAQGGAAFANPPSFPGQPSSAANNFVPAQPFPGQPGTLASPQSFPGQQPQAPGTLAETPALPPGGPPVITQGGAMLMAVKFAHSMSDLHNAYTSLARSCLRGAVLDELLKAEEHMSNMSFVGEHIVANGVDIVGELADAFDALQDKRYHDFGKDLGTAWRKVLLGKASDTDPSEPSADAIEPSPDAIAKVTEGFFASFFGKGTLHITTDSSFPTYVEPHLAEIVQPTTLQVAPRWQFLQPTTSIRPLKLDWTGAPIEEQQPSAFQSTTPLVLALDLRTCVAQNMPLFKAAYAPVWDLASQAADPESSPPQLGSLMLAMIDLQMAFTRCNIGPSQATMLIDAFELGRAHAQLDFASDAHAVHSKSGVTALLKDALGDFRDQRWYDFGSQLGLLLQGMVLVAFPQKYAVDDLGTLRSHIMGASEFGSYAAEDRSGAIPKFSTFMTASLFLFAGLLVLRSSRFVRSVGQSFFEGQGARQVDHVPLCQHDVLEPAE